MNHLSAQGTFNPLTRSGECIVGEVKGSAGFRRTWQLRRRARPGRLPPGEESIAQRRRGCSLSRVRVNGVIIHLRPGGRPGIVTL